MLNDTKNILFQHCKYIGYDHSALPLLQKAGIADALDEGVLPLPGEDGLAAFVAQLGRLRVWAASRRSSSEGITVTCQMIALRAPYMPRSPSPTQI